LDGILDYIHGLTGTSIGRYTRLYTGELVRELDGILGYTRVNWYEYWTVYSVIHGLTGTSIGRYTLLYTGKLVRILDGILGYTLVNWYEYWTVYSVIHW